MASTSIFEGFELQHVQLAAATLRVRYGGHGPAVLLLHGHPRTHATWAKVAPILAQSHTVVCPDLRGFGESTKPTDSANHEGSSKRAKAEDCVQLMRHLGHPRFAVVGHDRGSYVALRSALDHPEAISHLAVLDGVPIAEALTRCTDKFAMRWWHWFFYAQPDKPERAILADPDAWYGIPPSSMGEEAFSDFRRAIHDPATVHAMVEDYRAGLGIDREHDEEDRRQGRKVACPTLCLWAGQDDLQDLYGDVLGVWAPWTTDLQGGPIDCGHHIAEEKPVELAARLLDFLRQ